MDWKALSAELNKKLDPAAIKPAPQGKFGDYVDGYHVISEANRIFGNGGWSYEITRLQEAHRATVQLQGKNGPYEQFRCSYLCTVKVTVGDVFKEGSAVGMGSGKPDNMGDVIESAVKEAETDALKRALRTFGNTFGLALYDKSRENVGVEASDAETASAIEQINSLADIAALQAWWQALGKNARHVAENASVIAAKDKRKAEISERKAA
jgi:recombination DNA repair RAD52 pathway protein